MISRTHFGVIGQMGRVSLYPGNSIANRSTGFSKNRWEPTLRPTLLPKWHTYCVLETPNRWEPIVVAIDFAFWHTLHGFCQVIFPFCYGFWEVIFPFCNTLHGFWEIIFPFCNTLHGFCQVVFSIFQGIPKIATRG